MAKSRRFVLGAACGICLGAFIAEPSFAVTHDGDVATLPITIVDNRVIVDVTLNGSGPYKFILDSGAGRGAVLDAALFAHLGLTSNAESQESGAGEKTQRALHGTLASLAIGLGDLRFSKLPIRAVDLAPLAGVIGFPQLDGVLGDDLFRRYVVHVDYGSPGASSRISAPLSHSAESARGADSSLPGFHPGHHGQRGRHPWRYRDRSWRSFSFDFVRALLASTPP